MGKSPADERELYKGTASEETVIEKERKRQVFLPLTVKYYKDQSPKYYNKDQSPDFFLL